MASKRQQIFDLVLARMATISTANGYATNIGANAEGWRTTPFGEDKTQGLIVRDEIERTEIEDKNAGTYTRLLEFTVDLFKRSATSTDARNLIGDVIKAVGTDAKWGALARRSLPVSEQIMFDTDSAEIVGARVVFQVEFSRKPWEA